MALPGALIARAPAKINLTLHVLGRRADGYHELSSLVAFAGCHDTVTLGPSRPFGFTASGLLAHLAGADADNLVMRAANHLRQRVPGLRVGHFHLVKRLPVAAGIGGGSADAAAALRLLARLNDLPLAHEAIEEAARATGADVPVCLLSRARTMKGIGHDLGPPLALRLWAVLVNPRVPVATADVFRALGLAQGESRAAEGSKTDASLSYETGRNDLERPAIAIAPVIRTVIETLQGSAGCRVARMSGSGATCYGLFADCAEAGAAAKSIRRRHPNWWVKPTLLR